MGEVIEKYYEEFCKSENSPFEDLNGGVKQEMSNFFL